MARKSKAATTPTEKPMDRFETLKAEHREILDRRCPYLTPAQRDLAAHEAASRDIFGIQGENHMDPWAPLSPNDDNIKRDKITSAPDAIQRLMEKVNTDLASTPWNSVEQAIGREVYFRVIAPTPWKTIDDFSFLWDTVLIVRDRFRNAGWIVNIIATDTQSYFRFEWPTEPPKDPADDIPFEEY